MPTAEDAIAFVELLDLAETPADLQTLVGGGAESDTEAYVDAGSLVSFFGGVPLQHKEDVLNSVLLAQLAANAKCCQEKEVREWYGFYRNVLEKVGWVTPAFDFCGRSDLSVEFTADMVMLRLIVAMGTFNEVAEAATAIAALQRLGGEDPAVKVFETQSHTDRVGAFQIGVAAESNGVVAMKLAMAYFETDQSVVRALSFRFKTDSTKFFRASSVMNLNQQTYVKVREMVFEKLGRRAVELVRGLKT